MAQQVSSSVGTPGVEATLFANEADTAAYSGRLSTAREFSRQAEDSAERAGHKEAAATYSALSALREALFGNADEATRRATLAMKHPAGHDLQYASALACAYAGDDERAQKLTDDLGQKFPEATIVQFNYLPTLHAKLAVSKGNASEARETLRAALPYELGQTTYSSYGWTALYPRFCARGSLSGCPSGQRSRRRISEGPRPSRNCAELTHRRTGASPNRQSLCNARRHRQSQGGLSRFPHALERRRPRHPHPEASQSRVREIAMKAPLQSSRSILIGKFLPTDLPTENGSYSPFRRLGSPR